jgi:hypothetical protein
MKMIVKNENGLFSISTENIKLDSYQSKKVIYKKLSNASLKDLLLIHNVTSFYSESYIVNCCLFFMVENYSQSALKGTNTTYKNSGYIIHYLDLQTKEHQEKYNNVLIDFKNTCTDSKKFGGRAYRGKDYGGGVVFDCYEDVEKAVFDKIKREIEV